jgi:hypothetical protein
MNMPINNLTNLTLTTERTLKHSYMTISPVSLSQESHELNMLLHSQIPSALPVHLDESTGEPAMRYDVSGLECLRARYQNRLMGYPEIADFLHSLDAMLTTLEEYFLSENSLLLSPDTVFFDEEKKCFYYTLLPGQEINFTEDLKRMLKFILEQIDYSQDRTVILAYSLFQESSKDFFTIQSLIHITDLNLEKESKASEEPTRLTNKSQALSRTQDMPFTEIKDGILMLREEAALPTASEAGIQDGLIHNSEDDWTHEDLYTFPSDRELDPLSPQNENTCCKTAGLKDNEFPEVSDLSKVGSGSFIKALFHKTNKAEPASSASASEKPKSKELKETLNIEKRDRAIHRKLILSLAFMALLPSLIWFLKGAAVFKRLFPLILVLEIGCAVVTALDVLMAKLPEE